MERQCSIITDSNNRVHDISLVDESKTRHDLYPTLLNPMAVTVDWLRDIAYIVDNLHVSLPIC